MALFLASTSAIRRAMLDSAAVAYEARKPAVDERAVKARLSEPDAIASELASAKSLSIDADRDDWVIGSDSVVSVGGRVFDKPGCRAQAAEHLRFFSGKSMRLVSAVALAQGGAVDWSGIGTAVLHVRPLSETFIEDYLDAEWPDVGYCVGVFRLEGRGVQLFSAIDGDYFTILGMPLLALLGALRARRLIGA